MGKGLGIAALVVAISAIPIPIVGVFLAWLSLVIAVFAALAGQVPITVSVVAVSAVNLFLLSPSMWIASLGAASGPGGPPPGLPIYISIVALAAPIVAMGLRAYGLAATATTTTATSYSEEPVRPRRLPDR